MENRFNNHHHGTYGKSITANTKGIAGLAAFNSMKFPEKPGLYLGVGTGYYNGQDSISLGLVKRRSGITWNINYSSTGVVGAGVTWSLD